MYSRRASTTGQGAKKIAIVRRFLRNFRKESKPDSATLTDGPAVERRSLYLCEHESRNAELRD
jgi:hypothetical protein